MSSKRFKQIDGGKCRICLTSKKAWSFVSIFGQNGKYAKQIYDLTGAKILEFKICPARLCLQCIDTLHITWNFHQKILESNECFKKIYKICSYAEECGVVSDESDEWPMDPNDDPWRQLEQQQYTEPAEDVSMREELDSRMETEIKMEPEVMGTPEVKEEPEITLEPESCDFIVTDVDITYKTTSDVDVTYKTVSDADITYKNAADADTTYKTALNVPIKLEPEAEFTESTTEILKIAPSSINQQQNKEFPIDDLSEDVLRVMDEGNSENSDDEGISKTTVQHIFCKICGNILKGEVTWEQHMENVHHYRMRKMNIKEILVTRKNWSCDYCGLQFDNKKDCVQHKKDEHTKDEESLTCRYCSEQFDQARNLRIHIKNTHLNAAYVCPQCNKQFDNAEAFRSHMKAENMQRPHKCPLCPKSFMIKMHLSHHMNSHEGGSKLVLKKQKLPVGRVGPGMASTSNSSKVIVRKIVPTRNTTLNPGNAFRCGTCLKVFTTKPELFMHLTKDECS